MPVIRGADSRRSETPNGVMTTFASPAQGGGDLALWRVDMRAGGEGPLHAFDVEQVWTVLDGRASITLGAETHQAAPGDTFVMPVDVPRQVRADPADDFTAIVASFAGGRAYNPGGVTPEGACAMAPKDADRIVPPWAA